MRAGLDAVLFDLDGTLVDSAPDLAGAANEMRVARGLAPHPYAHLRPMVGTGARGMVGRAFGVVPGDAAFDALREDFLDRYERRIVAESTVFEEIVPVLAALDDAGVPWGIVTNKVRRFSEPLVTALPGLAGQRVLISGDTTPHAKPHPEPLFEAARRLGVDPARCVYVGDDQRDIVAGRAAGMATVVAGWGYLGDGEPVHVWEATSVADRPVDLLKWLELA